MANPSAPMVEGHAPFGYNGEVFQTYFKVFGELKGRTRTPVVVLHGGPGLTHDYLLPVSDLAAVGIPVILYDQLGNGRSTHLKEKPSSFWTIDLFIDELVNLLDHFSIQDSFDLLGHSWGGILAGEFEVRRQPAGLKHIVFSNALASGKLYGQSEHELLQAFPEWVQEGVQLDMKDPKKFYAALKVFYAKHCCQVQPFPKEFTDSFEAVFNEEYGDGTVMSAPILRGWSIIDRLHLVRVPSYIVNGRDDISQDFVVAPLFYGIARAKWVTHDRSSHMPFWEERERYNRLVAEFLALP